MEKSRCDLLNDMAEHMPILKNNQNTYRPRFDFRYVIFPKTDVLLLLCTFNLFVASIYAFFFI